MADGAGRTASFAYSSDGRLVQQTNADGATVSYGYDGAGNLTTINLRGR